MSFLLSFTSFLFTLVMCLFISKCQDEVNASKITSKLVINADSGRLIPDTFLGAFFEEINHAGAGGLWAELVNNRGISRKEEVNTSAISPFVKDALDGIEFARGSSTSKWGSLRASMGHSKPFDLRYVAIGNEECDKYSYQENYLKFYEAIKHDYPDIQIISNCDGSKYPLNHPADLYDFHIYTNSKDMFFHYTKFDKAPRSGPKAFVSEYAVWQEDAANGTLYAALAEAAFLIGLEKNSDVVSMVAYAPLFVNTNDKHWIPDAIVFNSYQNYGTPSYWLQHFFIDSSGATFLNSTLHQSSSSIVASTIQYKNFQDGKNYLKVKVVNFGNSIENLKILIENLKSNVQPSGSSMVVLTSLNKMDENSFYEPTKIVPEKASLENASNAMNVKLHPYSVTSFDLLI
ncbi:alpha-L-arabinofuranosidase 2-like isoform X2 [Vicia villosa]|uniref:alpha-L-arabinofuranosidase 2-like isoform X2 n=1 Tax=Vicia villosa TaxID=3911 RepID=UPI00273B2405|nr:alpha-L-arabinofuranosidase 2-like isoform X2 [Vicia villosa]